MHARTHTRAYARIAWPSVSKTYLFLSEGKQARNIEIWDFCGGDNTKGHCVLVRAAV